MSISDYIPRNMVCKRPMTQVEYFAIYPKHNSIWKRGSNERRMYILHKHLLHVFSR